MAEKSVVWSDRAKTELQDTLAFFNIRNGNTDYSFKILEQTEKRLVLLAKNPLLGRKTNHHTVRVLVMEVYLIFYHIHGDTIEILSFWDNRQDPNKAIVKP